MKEAVHKTKAGPLVEVVGHLHDAYQWNCKMDRVINPLVHSLENLIALARKEPRFQIYSLFLEVANIVRSQLTKDTYLSVAYRLSDQHALKCPRVDSMCVLAAKGRVASLVSVYTRAASRGKGLAKRTVRAALKIADKLGIASVRLEVAPQNEPAIAVYTGLGFEMTGRKVTHPVTKESFDVMVRPAKLRR